MTAATLSCRAKMKMPKVMSATKSFLHEDDSRFRKHAADKHGVDLSLSQCIISAIVPYKHDDVMVMALALFGAEDLLLEASVCHCDTEDTYSTETKMVMTPAALVASLASITSRQQRVATPP